MQFNTCTNERVEDSEPFDPETERKAIMKKWTKEVLSKSEKPNTNSFSHQNSKSKKPPREDSRKQQRSQEEKINSSQKKARYETAETQLNDIDKLMQKGIKLLLHWGWTGRNINFCITRNDIWGIETQNFSDHQNIAQESAPDFEGERVVDGGAGKDFPVLNDWWLGGHLWKERFFKRWVCGTFEIWVHKV